MSNDHRKAYRISKSLEDTERHLQNLSPWACLRAGQQLESRQGKTATVVEAHRGTLYPLVSPGTLYIPLSKMKR